MTNFKPQLLPNNEAGISPNWEERIEEPIEWLHSKKLDGARVEIFHDGTILGRSLKPLNNIHLVQMAKSVIATHPLMENEVLEAEFYSEEMTFSEIMHFFKSEDVTSDKTVKKYQQLWNKSLGDSTRGWEFPGRSVEWLTTWHSSLRFYTFDLVNHTFPQEPKMARSIKLFKYNQEYLKKHGSTNQNLVWIPQNTYTSIDEIFQAFDQAIISGGEGLVVIHKEAPYKFGRHTLNSKLAYKIKDDNLEFDGIILSVEEGTIAKEGSEKTINELGRSVTSKLQEDRSPSGIAKGFEVLMEDGNKLTVSLKDYNHEERRQLLYDHADYTNRWIRFTGMAPVKAGGCPRHAHFTKGNFRDDK